jgi:iron(III) transport system substrate-binding protein
MQTTSSGAGRLRWSSRYRRSLRPLLGFVALAALLVGVFGAIAPAGAQPGSDFDVQVRARLQADGDIEFGLRADGLNLTPTLRIFSARITDNRWRVSSVVERHGVQLQVIARRQADGDTEFGVRADGEDLLPRGRVFPADATPNRWLVSSAVSATSPTDPGTLTIYSGRGESLVGGIIERFEAETGIKVRVRYAGTAELALAIIEEGDRSPADIFYGQDAGALAALAETGAATRLPADILALVDDKFQDTNGRWIATSGRARVLVISPDRVPNPPDSVFDLVNPEWKGRIGWAPTNGSFQAFVTAMRQIHGEQATEEWLRGMIANDVKVYPKNSPQVQAVHDGELDIGLVNHYYLIRKTSVDPNWRGANHFTDPGEAGALINIAGVALIEASDNDSNALRFIRFLLSEEGQTYFREETFEYPVAAGVGAWPTLVPLAELSPPSLALTSLSDLEGTIELLEKVGALP